MVYNDKVDLDSLMSSFHRDGIHNIVVSPGPGTPEKEDDVKASLEVYHRAMHVPILGVCLGLQALATAHGAKIVRAPQPVHGRLSVIEHNNHSLFNGIPSGEEYRVVRYHSLVVDESSIPSNLQRIAWCSDSSYAIRLSSQTAQDCALEHTKRETLVMGLAHRSHPHYGVQYHPESIASAFGKELLQNFRNITANHWKFDDYKPELSQQRKEGTVLTLPREPHLRGDSLSGDTKPPHALQLHYSRMNEISIKDIPGGVETLFQHVIADKVNRDMRNTFWLDSATTDRARFSFLGGPGGSLWQTFTYKICPQDIDGPRDGKLTAQGLCGGETVRNVQFWQWLGEILEQYQVHQDANLPFNFCGGLIGYIGYEMKGQCGSTNRHDSEMPDAAFVFVDRFIAIDNETGDIWVVAVSEHESPMLDEAKEWIDTTTSGIQNLRHASSNNEAMNGGPDFIGIPAISSSEGGDADGSLQLSFEIREPYKSYIDNIERCMDALYSGDSYEICLTTQLSISDPPDPWRLYRILRRTNPAPYAAWMCFDKKTDVTICCCSPERFLRGEKSGMMEAKPIKGTVKRNRNASPEEDQAAANALAASEKDRAENLMIVDLLRNDLGRVCLPGSVHVPSLMHVESFATVHQLVSTVRGHRSPDISIAEAVRAAFPGGSMTGAPKVRSMAILDALEGSARGVYSGTLGYFSLNGTFDLNIVIRTAVFHAGRVTIGAGGAIVVQSNPDEEFSEMQLKASALTNAIQFCKNNPVSSL